MAFPLFPKLPGKDKHAEGRAKPELTPRHDARAGDTAAAVSAREVAAAAKGRQPAALKLRASPTAADARERDITVTGPPSLIEWTPPAQGAHPSIQVAEANPGLCSVLENAALLYASGHAVPARQVLEEGVASDNDAKVSPLAWLALFDLLHRTDDRAAFEQLALQYVVAFERSAPAWEERGPQLRPGPRPSPGGYFALTGKLSPANVPQIGHMLAATQKQSQVRLDLGSLTGADDAGAKLLADALAQLRKRQYALVLQHPDKIQRALESSVAQGRDAGEGYWTLLLELLQWQNDRKSFEDRAVDFAVAFELSPPSWEPPPSPSDVNTTADTPAAAAATPEMLCWQGTMTGSTDPQLAKFGEFRESRSTVAIDMSAVDRIDFVCSGALLNAIIRTEGQRKTVQIAGASPIIRALLLLIGISPRHFIKKPQ
ncbi:MAG TPA: STAS domain-containing protein [Casimicrobiaceae bacterium]|nr:STAS domain-containing protein [Casimicrobiaceae bacterium]